MTVLGFALLVFGALLLLAAAHPFITYPASLHLAARLRPSPVRPGRADGTGALCVCAYNEERVIAAKLENMRSLAASRPGTEVLAYVDGARDRTVDVARSFDDCVRLVASPERLGKTHGMNTLVAMTTADYLVFSDANVVFAPDALQRLLAPFGDPAVGCVCGHLIYVNQGGKVTASTGSLYWRLEESIKATESATGSVMGADGSIFALRRALHVPPPPDLIDDMFVSLKVLCQGSRIVRASDAYAYEEAISRPGEEFRRKIRIACQAFNVHRALWPELRRTSVWDIYKYVSHKLIRWLTIYLPAAGGALVTVGTAMVAGWPAAAALLLLGSVGLVAVLLVPYGPFAALRGVLEAFVATGLGVCRSLAGERFQTWTPPASSRGVGMPASGRTS